MLYVLLYLYAIFLVTSSSYLIVVPEGPKHRMIWDLCLKKLILLDEFVALTVFQNIASNHGAINELCIGKRVFTVAVAAVCG